MYPGIYPEKIMYPEKVMYPGIYPGTKNKIWKKIYTIIQQTLTLRR